MRKITKILLLVFLMSLSTDMCCAAKAQTPPDFSLPSQTFFRQKAARGNDRKVFGWFMVCCGAFNGGMDGTQAQQVAGYKQEIRMAQSMGIDGFGLDIMKADDSYHTATAAMFEAARELNTGFQLFFELDAGMPPVSWADYVSIVKQYRRHPNYYHVGKLPLVGAYGADVGITPPSAAVTAWSTNFLAPLKAAGINVHFVPTTFGQFGTAADEVAGWGEAAQGQSVWQIQLSPIGGGLPTLESYASALHGAGKSWMSTISTHYWVGSWWSVPSWCWNPPNPPGPECKKNGSYSEHAGGAGLEAQWKSVLGIQKPEWVMLLTWNDYNESYMEPVDDYKKYANGTAQGAPLGWYKPQAGMDELNRYYVQWYKTGVQPVITADSLFYAYRTSSSSLKASSDTRPPVTSCNGPDFADIPDNIYVTTALTAPAQLKVVSGDTTIRYDVPAGIAQTTVPFHAGVQTFSLWRKGMQINSVTGEPVVTQTDFYDYWPTTGFVETPRGK